MRFRRSLVLPVIFLCWIGSIARGATARNVLVLLSDDQRPDTIHALGNSLIRTPNLDALAARGTAFTNAHIMGGLVGAICMPSRCMILSGRTLFRAPPTPGNDVPLFPEEYRKAGYVTFGTGKWHNGPPAYARCFSSGGSIFFGGMNDQVKMPVADFNPAGQYPARDRRVGETYSTELFADSAVKFLDEYGKGGRENPFLMWVAFTAPHDPRMKPAGYEGMYSADAMPLPKNFMPQHPFDNGEMAVRDEKLLPHPRPEGMVRQDLADYYAMITHLDAQIGRIVEALRQAGEAERTLIVFAGDNGLAIGSHGLLGKQNLYEHSVGVPLIVAGPGVKEGQRSDALVYLLDLYPTIAELTGQPLAAGVEGKSFAPVLRGETERHHDSLFFAYRHVQRAVRDERYKLIRYEVGGKVTEQLFDLKDDEEEMKDLSKDREHAGTLERMRRLLSQHQERLGDPTGAWKR